ncbi:hypothetical protein LCGC14_1778990 [marine sediment metagenome]|uniref:Uncharacterized protein n=1 Tax=marine sediment metagenome TaxID=412755 RepID=A0A0F9JVN3_9ZZZZ
MLKNTDLYIIACMIQQRCIDEYDEEMIDNIFQELVAIGGKIRDDGELRTI